MVQDPKQKARRLARAQSWQEYVEQVGADLARNTPFWTEALNEILAGGNKVF